MADKVIRNNKITLSARAVHPAPPEKIFPLLCPVLEYDWIPTWKCEIQHSLSGFMERGCVFTTDLGKAFPTGLPDIGPETWVAFRYQPGAGVGFVRTSAHVAILFDISLIALPDGGCELTWTQGLTPLSDLGREYVAVLEQGAYEKQIEHASHLLNEYLTK